MGYIAVSDLIQEMTPEQRILVSQFYARFDNRAGANRRIVNVEPFFYQGAILASEFLVVAATKVYLCLSLDVDTHIVDDTTEPGLQLFNEAGVISFITSNLSIAFNGVNLTNHYNNSLLKDCFFSYVVQNSGTAPVINLKFIGYRITLI